MSWSQTPLVEDRLRIDVRVWSHGGHLRPGHTFEWNSRGLSLTVRVGDQLDSVCMCLHGSGHMPVTVTMERTPCHYGGGRPWWVCPACSRRAAILYESQGGFACRRCLGLVYRSQRESTAERALSLARYIRESLGGTGSLEDSFPPRPTGMRLREYLRLYFNAVAAEERWLVGVAGDCHLPIAKHLPRSASGYTLPRKRQVTGI